MNRLRLPSDVEEELNAFWASTAAVVMDYDAMFDSKRCSFLAPLLMTKTRTFARCDVLQRVFPALRSLTVLRPPLTSLTLFYLKSVIADLGHLNAAKGSGGGGGLREIRMVDPKTTAMSVAAVIDAEQRNLAEMQWTMESVDGCLLLKHSEDPVVIKEPTPPPAPTPAVEEKAGDGVEDEEDAAPKKVVRRKVIRKRIVKRKKVVKSGAAPSAPSTEEANPSEEGQAE